MAHGLVCASLGIAVLAVACFDVIRTYGINMASAFSGEPVPSQVVQLDGREFALGSKHIAQYSAAVLELLKRESAPGERLFVGGGDLRRAYATDTFLYHMAPWLTPATYFMEMNPFSANRSGSRLAMDVASADWLVLNHLWESCEEPNGSTWKGSDAPNAVVRERFALRATFGCMQVYRRIGTATATAAR